MRRALRRLREWLRPTGLYIVVPKDSTLIMRGSPRIDTLEVHGQVTLGARGAEVIAGDGTMVGTKTTRHPKRKAKAKRKAP